MALRRYWFYLFLIVILVVAVDQLLKWLVYESLTGRYIHLIPGLLSFILVENRGAVFGILPGKKWLFISLSLVIILFTFYLYHTSEEKEKLYLPLGFLLGGTIGNLIDRMRFGYVIDYIDIYLHRYHWPAFNLADLSICIGAGLLVYTILFRRDTTFKGK